MYGKRLKIVRTAQAIRNWWSRRLTAKCQLHDLEYYVRDYDYRQVGSNQWLTVVSLESLFQSFQMETAEHESVTYEAFALEMKRIVQPPQTRHRTVRHPDPNRETYKLQKRRTFWAFRSLEAQIEIFDRAAPLIRPLTPPTPHASIELSPRKAGVVGDEINRMLK